MPFSIRFLTAALLVALTTATLSAQSPAPGSGAAGVAAWAAANCNTGSCVNPAATANGEFSIELLSVTKAGSLVTYDYEICQTGGQNALSHWIFSGAGLDCLATGQSLNDLIVGGTLNGVAASLVVGVDPQTQVNGIKFDVGVNNNGCNSWSITLDESVLAPGFELTSGCVLAATKAGSQTILDANSSVPGYACIAGPVCGVVPGKIGDLVFCDDDCDGIKDASEVGLEGVVLELFDAAGVSLGTTTTDANGAYCFEDLAAGTYTVTIDFNDVAWALSPANVGNDEALDSDFDGSSYSVTVTLNQGEENNDVDAGLCSLCPGPVATTISKPCGYDPVNDPQLFVDPLVVGEKVTFGYINTFPNSYGLIFYSVGPVTPVQAAGCNFYVDVLNQAANVFLASNFVTDAAGNYTETSVQDLPLAYLGLEVIFQGRICDPNGIGGPFAPLPDFFSNAICATIGCPPACP